MDSYVKAITLDVNADENYTIIKAKQGDKINRKIAITLKKDGANFTPTGVSQIWFRVQKPDKNIAIVKSTDSGNPISSAGNVYTVTLSEQCLTASGKAWCDLAFLDSSGNTLSSCAFILNIIPMPNGNTARSISEWTDLQQAIDDAERFASIVAFRTSGNYIQYTVDGTTWVNLTTVGAIGGDLQTQINALNGAITSLGSDDIANDSTNVSGLKVTNALDTLNGAINTKTVDSAIAIVSNSNTHAAITAGQFVYVKNHSTLSEGLYKATANIAANGTLSTSNVSTVPDGGLNDVRSTLRSSLYGQNIAGGGSMTIPRGLGGSAIVYAIRASTSATPCLWIVDQWGGICAISNNPTLATLSYNSSTYTFTLTNVTSSYLNLGYIYLFP